MGGALGIGNDDCEAEEDRLAALTDLAILDTAPDPELDTICQLAAHALKTPSAGLTLVARNRMWFKARHNIPLEQVSRETALCTHTVEQAKSVVVLDASTDKRFCRNPYVTGERKIRFYAGAPLILESGFCVGSLCVVENEPREALSDSDLHTLEQLAALASRAIERKRDRHYSDIAGKVIDTTSDAVIAADRSGTIVFVNPAAENMFGYSRQEAVGRNVDLVIPPRFRRNHQKLFENAVSGGPTRLLGTTVELPARHRDGTEFPADLSLAPWGQDDDLGGFAAIIRDMSDHKALEDEGRRSREFLDGVLDNIPAMLFVKDAETRKYIFVNRKTKDIVGLNAEDMIGCSDSELFPSAGKAYENRDKLARQSEGPFVYESKFEREDGSVMNIRTTRVIMEGPESKDQYILGMCEDLTAVRAAEAENYRLARYDTLTGLLNRAKLAELLKDLVGSQTRFALLSIDLDRFKAVNDQFGHLTGDEVLKEVGSRIEEAVEKEDFAARIGGDEFMAVLIGNNPRKRAKRIAEGLIERIRDPMKTTHATAHLGASIGIAVFPDDAATTEKLRENADLALYRAKNLGRGIPCFFDDAMDAAVRDRRKLENELRRAVDENLIGLAYQPVVSTTDRRITSVEALARWTHPVLGMVPPDQFISLAEDCGLIDKLGEQLLRQACEDATSWPSDVRVAVNLSPLQFSSSELLGTVGTVLDETGLTPNRLQLEVTERLVLQNVEQTFSQLEALRKLGIQILVDDFGVGHSSLSYFQRFHFDKVKIDKSFVNELETSQAARAIVEAVVGLGRQLEMGVVAEGVETLHQQQLLTEIGCTHLQGYLFSRPTDIVTLKMMLDEQGKIDDRISDAA